MDSLFSRAVLERCTADIELPTLPGGPARVLGGFDYGVVRDKTALAWYARLPVAALNPGIDHPVFVVNVKAWPAGEPLSNPIHEVIDSDAAIAVLSSEDVGVGAGPTQEVLRRLRDRPPERGGLARSGSVMVEERPWLDTEPLRVRTRERGFEPMHRGAFATVANPVNTSAQSKALVYERLRWLMDRGQLVLPRDGDLLRELASLRVELRPGGTERIEAAVGHDDRPDAMYIAAAPHRGRDGRLHCYLARLSESQRPDSALPEGFEAPVVETGSGLKVHRSPPLQSVAGSQLTLPRSSTTTEPRRIGRFRVEGAA